MSPGQLAFDLPHRAALGAEDFLVSDCNLAAVRMVDAWPEWPGPVQVLVGPPASGKTHLVRVWQERSSADALDPTTLDVRSLDARPPGSALAVEDADRSGFDERTLFHLLNLAAEKRFSVLLTARISPIRWPFSLPDLLSRLSAVPVTEIGAPDEVLLRTVMLKHFSDRQLTIEPKVLEFLAVRIDRSLEAAAAAVEAVDQAALRSGRKISRQLVAEALERAATIE
ncbi:DnaA/Hda family protein [Methyloceanibacter caenitepidi]|uniref:DnaA regulatory inactivator Hda n=1 Tax=Methyloceanibacter caenitepidi TaxID=1384459 RepID=A0A0A8K5Q8_9HYPH|nr:DnaA/Hda family protein [Methyloceanibacter caenitepidi]BAQ17847.1 DnaA regulatory inactivator Hda [Methyloceanibacter caenitepidi]